MRRQGAPPGVDVAAAYMRLNDEFRPAQVAARDELAETVAAELRPGAAGARPGSTWWGLARRTRVAGGGRTEALPPL